MTLPVDAQPVRTRHSVLALLRAFLCDDDGQDLIEYAFLAAFFGITGYVALSNIGPAVGSTYNAWLDPTNGTPRLWEPAPPWNSSGS